MEDYDRSLKVYLRHESGKYPQRKYDDAGFDLFSSETKEITPGTREVIRTGLSMILPKNTYAK